MSSYLSNYYYQQPQQQQTQGQAVGQGITNAAGSAVQGYAQGVQGVQDFSIDPYAGFKGSGQGLASGGVIGAIAGGVGAQVGQFGAINKKLKGFDTSVNLYQTDPYGNPVYMGEAQAEAQRNMKALQQGQASLYKGFDPANFAFAGLFGTGKKLRRKRRELRQNLGRAQREFNEENITATQTRLQREQYNDMLGDPYGINTGYY